MIIYIYIHTTTYILDLETIKKDIFTLEEVEVGLSYFQEP